MLENRDPAIKLFGKTIALPPEEEGTADEEGLGDLATSMDTDKDGEDQDEGLSDENMGEDNGKDEADHMSSEEASNPVTCSTANDVPKTPSLDKETPPAKKALKLEEEQGNTNDSNSKEKPLKKPDKILPCPRCNSLDTKFCYYNNYNVNQPRHFCKNCQRYWTAGGTMRNVPVGAGRRKNKNSAAHYRHLAMSAEAIHAARAETTEAINLRSPLKPNGTVLSFGSDAPLCESMASVLSLAEKTMRNCHRNGFHRAPEEKRGGAVSNGGDMGDEHSSGSSITACNSAEDGTGVNLQRDHGTGNCPGFAPRVACFPGAPWPYPWNVNPPQWNSPLPPPPPPPPPPPASAAPFYPLSFYPAPAYWGCTIPAAWSVPWVAPVSPNSGSSGSESNYPTLGKHPRDQGSINGKVSDPEREDSNKEGKTERYLWIPKTLRIDDPGEAARSSIWATLGIKHDKAEAVTGGGLFKAFQTKAQEKTTHTAEANQVLHANPAALSRSRNFHERS